MRLRQEMKLPWREIARVMGLNTTTVFGWAQRYAAEGDAGLVSRKRGRTYLSGRTLTLPQEWVLRTDPDHGFALDTGFSVCPVEPPRRARPHQGRV